MLLIHRKDLKQQNFFNEIKSKIKVQQLIPSHSLQQNCSFEYQIMGQGGVYRAFGPRQSYDWQDGKKLH